MTHIARTPKQLGTILQRYRKKRGLTQGNLGEKTKLRQATISHLEAGRTSVQLGNLLDVLTALDLELVIQPRSKGSPTEIESST